MSHAIFSLSGGLGKLIKIDGCPCDRDLILFNVDDPMPVAFRAFLQTSDNDLSTHEAGAASGAGGNVQLRSKVILHRDLLFHVRKICGKNNKKTANDSSGYSK